MDWDALVDRIRVLEGDVVEREVLVVWLKGVQDPEADHTGAEKRSIG